VDSLEFTLELIRRASVSPDDAGCQALIAEHLSRCGFAIEHLRFGDVDNLWARRGQDGPVLCFAGHTDVVPAGPLEQWKVDPFAGEIRGGQLVARGAADMKASLAAMIVAVEQFVDSQPNHIGSIAFLITSDEEGRARDGTLKVIETLRERGEHIDWCVIGEPSSTHQLGDTARIGRRGSLSGMLTLNGEQGHVAYPLQAQNPIHAFARFVQAMTELPLDDGNAHFPPTSFQVVQVTSDAGAPNVTPAKLSARFNLRYSTVWTHETLTTHIRNLIDGLGIEYDLDWHLSGEPFLTAEGKLSAAVQQAVQETTNLIPELSTSGGTSDGRFISPAGADVIEFGPVNATIHKVNETLDITDIPKLETIYRRIAELMLT
jgi:succinyl-diaminopimelate desuccinylase